MRRNLSASLYASIPYVLMDFIGLSLQLSIFMTVLYAWMQGYAFNALTLNFFLCLFNGKQYARQKGKKNVKMGNKI